MSFTSYPACLRSVSSLWTASEIKNNIKRCIRFHYLVDTELKSSERDESGNWGRLDAMIVNQTLRPHKPISFYNLRCTVLLVLLLFRYKQTHRTNIAVSIDKNSGVVV